ncbi:Hypothetical protein NGAL_HAMBI1145_47030 [Neorhizobium galegae bv. officinalis]|uniref:Uncharacterized protein n=1 Tax=Neorhizobium galegae bv. officinalis TaxID=323656 RepID=A0A0T7FVQ9_NEOGA|nr:Hypothetical protein NGAL_HAMBI1145_47030 [Neorhizobium galegae bv. officinalis]
MARPNSPLAAENHSRHRVGPEEMVGVLRAVVLTCPFLLAPGIFFIAKPMSAEASLMERKIVTIG